MSHQPYFRNSIEDELSLGASDIATTFTLKTTQSFGGLLPDQGRYIPATLIDSVTGEYEIVHVTNNPVSPGATITVVRGRDGTTARAWLADAKIYAGVPAAELNRFIVNYATGFSSVAISPYAALQSYQAVATGDYSTAMGVLTNATGIEGVNIGYDGDATGDYSIAIGGRWAEADSLHAVAVGRGTKSYSERAIAMGASTQITWYGGTDDSVGAVAIGDDIYGAGLGKGVLIGAGIACESPNAVLIGGDVDGGFEIDAPVGIGYGAIVKTDNTCHIQALQAVPGSKAASAASAAWTMSSASAVIMSETVNLAALSSYTIPMPTGVTFFPEEVGVIVIAATGVTGQPTVQFGVTGTVDKYLAPAATVGLAAVGDRHRFTTLAASSGAANLRAEITVAATGTTLTGRFYWRGMAAA